MKKGEVIAIDVGYGHTKIVTSDQPIIFPSQIGPARELTFALTDKAEAPGEKVMVGDQAFLVGKSADHCNTTFVMKTRDWISSPIYAAVITSVFARVMPSLDLSAELSIVAGLPVDYIGDKATAAAQIRSVASTANINLKSVEIIPQPFGTFFDHVLDMSGEPKISAASIGLIGIIDIGYHSTDFILVQGVENNIERAGGSITTGAFTIYDYIRSDLMHRFGRNNITLAEIEDCVRRRQSLKIGKHTQDVSVIVQTHMRNTAQTIIGAIRSKWSQEGELDTVLLTGGGGSLLRDYLNGCCDDTRLVPGPQMANARGYYKRGMFVKAALKSL